VTDALLGYETIAHDSTSSESNHQRQSGCEINPWKQGLELYDQLRPSLLAYLHNLGLSRENGEDVLQETFVRLVEHIRSKTADDNLRGWIYRVAYNLSMDIHRMERRYPPCSLDWMDALEPSCREPVDPAPGPEERVIQGEDSHRLKSAVLTLTLQQRNCVLLRAKGLRYTEIAATLGISEQRARILQKRGTTLIAAWL
jgi:RNA polymerase sigma-70 factor (ECF subfamily)